ncbi:uncharacterized protein M421DRAFT_88766 [Didymella exigua CBS 183.55]|uniref:Uncharacterized protein n=1 Tax=Didymella exigua CBS 183.55 TaxID=1150837 RepID=A0A6A5S518_9PLEO|nr:uncharacterized protein M421DRAFT_88766 [Didymella exigua CBS 183.55]KAF1933586.1 hypothetical protein M421DRAFT_88766 [Didymella exigua CBS 183.55]
MSDYKLPSTASPSLSEFFCKPKFLFTVVAASNGPFHYRRSRTSRVIATPSELDAVCGLGDQIFVDDDLKFWWLSHGWETVLLDLSNFDVQVGSLFVNMDPDIADQIGIRFFKVIHKIFIRNSRIRENDLDGQVTRVSVLDEMVKKAQNPVCESQCCARSTCTQRELACLIERRESVLTDQGYLEGAIGDGDDVRAVPLEGRERRMVAPRCVQRGRPYWEAVTNISGQGEQVMVGR